MPLIVPYLPLNPLLPRPKGAKDAEGMKKQIPSNNTIYFIEFKIKKYEKVNQFGKYNNFDLYLFQPASRTFTGNTLWSVHN